MNAGQLAALIAAGFWAVLVCAGVYVLARLARLITAARRAVAGYREGSELLMERAQAVLDRTSEQLARTDAITGSMDQVTANMAELSGHVTDLAGLARGISAAFGAPLLRIAAAAFGVRRAVAIRRSVPIRAAGAQRQPAVAADRRVAVGHVAAGRPARQAARARSGPPRLRASSRLDRRERARR